MKVETTSLPGVLVFTPQRFKDERGYFFETWQQQRYAEHGINQLFVQDNYSRSSQGVLRGLHYQNPNPQGKLVSVCEGEVFDVAVDIRQNSENFGKWFGIYLSAENGKQMWVPPGFAHGFLVTSEHAGFTYKCTDFYSPKAEMGLRWNDPTIAIDWPAGTKILSPKDKEAQLLLETPSHQLVFQV
jgi:dTDP-4-dehydrorhamnose 3,5-epimerase